MSSSQLQLHIKAKYESQCRRFKVDSNLTYKQFLIQIESMFQKAFALENVSFKYVDDESDVVDLENEEEYKEALRITGTTKDKILRIMIEKKGTKPQGPNVMKEVQQFFTKTFEESNKVINQENFKNVYEGILAKLNDLEAQKRFQEAVNQIGTILNNVSATNIQESLSNVFDQFYPQVKVEKKEEPKEQPKKEEPKVVEKKEEPKVVEVKKVLHSARFVKDVTLEDGAEVPAGEEFKKVWKLKNTGTDTWENGVYLLYLGGSQEFGLLNNSKFPVQAAKANEEVDVVVNLFAPKQQGVYEANFRLCTKEGEEFGNKLNLKVVAIEKKVEKVDQTKKWATELVFLHDMGFTDDTVNVKLLEQFKGDLTSVVQNILGNN